MEIGIAEHCGTTYVVLNEHDRVEVTHHSRDDTYSIRFGCNSAPDTICIHLNKTQWDKLRTAIPTEWQYSAGSCQEA
jgi:hypothetical protein